MTRKSLLATVVIFCAGAASAQSAWDGSYAGLSFSTFSGENAYDYDPVQEFDLSGKMTGVFFGHSWAFNKFVLGGEIALSAGDVFEEDFENQYEYDTLLDLKLRLGYDAGKFMPYGLIGMSYTNLSVEEEDNIFREFEQLQSGFLTGLGFDFAVNDQFRLGAELTSRKFDFEAPFIARLPEVEGTIKSISLRASYNF